MDIVCACLFLASLGMPRAAQSCTTVVTVDETLGQTCDCFSENLAGKACDDLQCVLSSINATRHNRSDCARVRLLPGRYTVIDTFQCDAHLQLIGTPGVSVTFNLTHQFDPS